MEKKFALIIPAAGEGLRLGTDTGKAFLDLDGMPMVCRTMERFNNIDLIAQRIVAVRPDDIEIAGEHLEQYDAVIVEGGVLRQDSVMAALSAVQCEYAVIHDAARPFVSENLIRRVLEAALATGAAIAAVPVTDTIKSVKDGLITETIPRNRLWAAQTPQAFGTDLLRTALKKVQKQKIEVTDDAAPVEMLPHPIQIVEGEHENIKITTWEDLERARKS